MKKIQILFLVFIGLAWLGASRAMAGEGLVFKISDASHAPLTGAVVRLLVEGDSTARTTFSNDKGEARFDDIDTGMYLVTISHVSYQAVERTIAVSDGRREFEIQLTTRLNKLGAVTVTAARPLIRQEDDKTIIDPEPLANSSTNTLEVLESTPGLYVDQDGGIFLNSMTPAVVYINGREMKMSNQDISTILRSLPPGSVLRIEVIRTPSTKYDAASSGGIINIVLKKGVKIGRFGSVNAGMNQGFYGNQQAGVTFNNSGEKNTQYINLNFSRNDRLEEILSLRVLKPDTMLDQTMRTRHTGDQGYLSYGFTHQRNEKLSFNYDGRVNLSLNRSETRNANLIEGMEDLRFFESDNTIHNRTPSLNLQQDLGMMLKPDTTGNEWDTKVSYTFQQSRGAQDYSTLYLFPFSTSIYGEGENLQVRHFLTLQSDLTWLLPFGIKTETGVKSSLQDYDSRADFLLFDGCLPITDTLRTNAFRHLEVINAAYLQASRNLFGDFLLKMGVRMEHTYMAGHQTIPSDTSFVVNRVDWFPYVYLSHKVFRVADFELRGYIIYRRTINRPGYQSLNPSVKYVDQFLYEAGNPALKPQFTDNFEINVSYDDMPFFAFGRNYTRDIFASVVYQDPEQESVAVRTYDNLGKNVETYFRLMAGIPPGKKYFFAVGAQYNLNAYDGVYENQPLQYTRGGWRFFTFHSLTLFKETKLNLSGFYMYKGNFNFYELEPFGALNLGISQTFFHKRLHITLNARDLLGTMEFRATLKQGTQDVSGYRYTDNQRIGINIRYDFGIKSKEERRGMPEMEMGE